MIKQRLSLLLSLNFLTLSQGIFLKPARSQVTPDGTTNTRVDVSGNDFTIQEGNRAGSNLFHSFQDFSVPNGGSAFFNNAADIANILSRVTGGNISNIDGLIRANGSANLFLLNPAGILFGSGARLDIGGSFLGSTADSLLFPDGEFSATDLDNPPLLTINAPIGLGFRDEPAPITNRFDTGSVILEVPPGANLTLVGGDINFENIGLIARRGRVDLGGLSEAGIVTINENGSLSFPDGIERADVTFTNNAFVSVRAGGGGSITVNARNVELSEGEIGGSFFLAGIARDSGSSTAQAGDITINATDNISLDGSEISNEVRSLGEGQGGDINITANSVSLSNGSALSSDINPEGQGDAGNIIINATESISFSGVGSDGFGSRILARVRQEATGTGGDVNITTETLSFNRGNILAGAQGEGDGGNITINANNIVLDGSEIRSSVASTGIGNAGSIQITTDSLSLANDTVLRTNIDRDGQGNAGRIEINANSVFLSGGSEFLSGTGGQGNAGNIIINATESISFSGVGSDGFGSGIFARVSEGATGNGGDINITTETVSLNRGNIVTDAQGEGDGGNITIDANNIVLDGSEIRSSVSSTGIGNAGSIQITTDSLSLDNNTVLRTNIDRDGQGNAGRIEINANSIIFNGGSEILSDTGGQGNAGNIIINATESISFSGVGSDGFGSGIFARVSEGATGNGGDVNITTTNLSLAETNQIVNDTNGNGNAGNVTIKASNILLDGPASGIRSAVFSSGVGNAGNINITTDSLALANGASLNTNTGGRGDAGTVEINANSVSLSNGSVLSSDTRGQGDAGNIIIIATDSISFDGDPSGIFARVRKSATGNGGNVELATTNLSLTDGAQIVTDTSGNGNAGDVTIDATNIVIDGSESGIRSAAFSSGIFNAGKINITTDSLSLANDAFLNTNTGGRGDAGTVEINANSVSLRNGSVLTSDTRGQGNAGNIIISATDSISFDGDPSGIFARVRKSATGNGGNVELATTNLSLTDGAQIVTDTQGEGDAGNVTIKASNILLDGSESGIRSAAGLGNAGNIKITTDSLSLTNDAFLNTSTGGQGNAGTVEINATSVAVDSGSEIRSETSGQGNGGNVIINASDSLSVDGIGSDGNGSAILARSFREAEGSGGNINITTDSLSVTNQAEVNVSSSARGSGGNITVEANLIELDRGTLEAETRLGEGGNITLGINDNLIMREESLISAQAFEEANGGNINIDAEFIIAFPSQINGNDIIARAEQGQGGNIKITAESVFNIKEREAIDGNGTNDIDASSEFGLDGNVSIFTPDTNILQADIELPNNVVEPETLGANACSGGGETEASSFTVKGKGGVPPVPTEPFMADPLIPDGKPITMKEETDLTSLLVDEIEQGQENPNYIPAEIKPIETSIGDIYPARGVIKTEDGRIILTTYPTDNINTRTPHKSANCNPS